VYIGQKVKILFENKFCRKLLTIWTLWLELKASGSASCQQLHYKILWHLCYNAFVEKTAKHTVTNSFIIFKRKLCKNTNNLTSVILPTLTICFYQLPISQFSFPVPWNNNACIMKCFCHHFPVSCLHCFTGHIQVKIFTLCPQLKSSLNLWYLHPLKWVTFPLHGF